MKIAFLGLGRMGTEPATHLVTDGHDVTVWNRTAEATGPLVERGARAGREASDAIAGAEVGGHRTVRGPTRYARS